MRMHMAPMSIANMIAGLQAAGKQDHPLLAILNIVKIELCAPEQPSKSLPLDQFFFQRQFFRLDRIIIVIRFFFSRCDNAIDLI